MIFDFAYSETSSKNSEKETIKIYNPIEHIMTLSSSLNTIVFLYLLKR
jgi:hypothetical protein